MMGTELQELVNKSGLDSTKAKAILKQFNDYFDLASEWELKAKTIVVTDETQEEEMQQARDGRLFLARKRIDIEHVRVSLKEQSLREGKAIDGIANVLKALIIPIEKYLSKQENFIKIREAKKVERLRLWQEKEKAERIRIWNEKIEADREKNRLENEKLREENKIANDKIIAEKMKTDKLKREQQVKENKLRREKEELEEKLRNQIECPKCHHKFNIGG